MNYQDAILNNPVVYECHRRGMSPEQIVVQLVLNQQNMIEELKLLRSIAPQRIETEDGKVFVWHCPNELIPVTKIDACRAQESE